MLSKTLASLVFVTTLFVAANPVQADWTIWEKGSEADDPKEHRFVALSGFLQPGWIFRLGNENSGDTSDGAVLRRARLGVHAKPAWWIKMSLQAEFGYNNETNFGLRDAYISLEPHDFIHIKLGQMRVPFISSHGFDEARLGFLDRPLYVAERSQRNGIGIVTARDIGLQVTGQLGNLTESFRRPMLEYAIGVFGNVRQGGGGLAGAGSSFLLVGRLQLHILGLPEGAENENDFVRNTRPRLRVGGAVYSNCKFGSSNRGTTVDLEGRYQGFYASASFTWLRNGPTSAFGHDDCSAGIRPAIDGVSRGAHVQLQWVMPEKLFPVKKMKLELLTRFDWVDPLSGRDPDSPLFGTLDVPESQPLSLGEATRYRMSFGVNWYPTESPLIRLQVQYQLSRQIEDFLVGGALASDVPHDVLWLQFMAGI